MGSIFFTFSKGLGVRALKIKIKNFSLSLSNSSLVLFVCGGDNVDGITIMTEYQKCIQGAVNFPKSCFDESIIPSRVFKFAISANDIEEAISMMPGSSVELSCIDEGMRISIQCFPTIL